MCSCVTVRKYGSYDEVHFKMYLHVMDEAREVFIIEVEFELFLSPSSSAALLLHSYRTGCTCSPRNCKVEIKHRRYPDNKL